MPSLGVMICYLWAHVKSLGITISIRCLQIILPLILHFGGGGIMAKISHCPSSIYLSHIFLRATVSFTSFCRYSLPYLTISYPRWTSSPAYQRALVWRSFYVIKQIKRFVFLVSFTDTLTSAALLDVNQKRKWNIFEIIKINIQAGLYL